MSVKIDGSNGIDTPALRSGTIQAGQDQTPAKNVSIVPQGDGTAQVGFGPSSGLLTLLMKLLASGQVEFPNGLISDAQAAFPAGLTCGPLGNGSGVVKNANGTAIQLPGGFILQIGSISGIASGGSAIVNLPVPFPNSFMMPFVSRNAVGVAGTSIDMHAYTNSNSQFTIYYFNSGGGVGNANWLAIGY